MKWATKEQYQAAKNALDALNQHSHNNHGEDDTFLHLNDQCHATQQPLAGLQRFWLYTTYQPPQDNGPEDADSQATAGQDATDPAIETAAATVKEEDR